MTTSTAAPRLLERESELALADDRVRGACEGRGSVLLVEGPAGIGKTELLRATRERGAEAGMEALSARGGELEQSIGFGIVRQLFEARLTGANPSERRALLAGAAELVAPAIGLKGPRQAIKAPSLTMGDPAESIQHGLYWLCANLCERSPLLLCVDDLHWVDAASARWLIYLARRLVDLRVLVLAATRSGEPGLDPELLRALSGEDTVTVVHPGALSEAASGEVVRMRLGDDAEPAFCTACHRAAGGNPFLLGELVEALSHDAVPPTAESVGRIEDLAPETISRSMLLRLARLPAGAEPLARAIAILGTDAELRHAAGLADLDEATAASAADALAGAAILAPGRPLRFAHPLIRAAVYEQIPEAERALAHARAARLLADESAPAEAVAAQLLHAEPAGDETATATLRQASDEAMARGAPEVAISHLRRGLAESPPMELRLELLRDLLDAGMVAADFSILDGLTGDPVREITRDAGGLEAAGFELARWMFGTGRIDEATEVSERTIAAAIETGDYARAIAVEAPMLSVMRIGPREALARLERYADQVQPGSAEERLWLALRGYWLSLFGGPAADSAEFARRALEGGALIHEHADTALGQSLLALLRADELDTVEAAIDVVLEDAGRRGSITSTTAARWLTGAVAYRRGDVATAAAEVGSALAISREQGSALVIPVYTAWLVDALIERGELDAAEAELEASDLAGSIPFHPWFTPVLYSRGTLRLAEGRAGPALEDLRVMLDQTHDTFPGNYSIASTIALALQSLGTEPEEARRLVEWELESAYDWGTPRAIGVALRARGIVEGGGQGIETLREAVEALADSPARLEHARALADLGAALRRANRRQEARGPLKQAMEMAHRGGASVIEARAREELTATGARPRRLMLSGVESLTPSELRTARMAADGMENKEIAQALFVSVKTVETHLGHAYGKLEVSSRKELPTALEGRADSTG